MMIKETDDADVSARRKRSDCVRGSMDEKIDVLMDKTHDLIAAKVIGT